MVETFDFGITGKNDRRTAKRYIDNENTRTISFEQISRKPGTSNNS